MLELKNIYKSFGKKIAINNLSFSIPEGKIFGFIGPNGAGKTTTIKSLATLIAPDSGNISIKNIDIVKNPQKVKNIIGYIPDTPFLYEKLTGREFIEFTGEIFNIKRDTLLEKINLIIKNLGFGEWIDQLIETYSHGMKQRIVIASAFIHDPYLLLVDEPMVGLDPISSKRVKQLFLSHAKKGNIVFISTHTLSIVEDICDIVGVILKGELVYIGTPDDMKKESSLEQVFLQITAEKND